MDMLGQQTIVSKRGHTGFALEKTVYDVLFIVPDGGNCGTCGDDDTSFHEDN